jgi:hypothetical protein
MPLARRQLLKLAASAAALPFAGPIAHAQAWPSRPLRIVIGYPAGGSTDLIARIIGNWLSPRLGQPVIIEERPYLAKNVGKDKENNEVLAPRHGVDAAAATSVATNRKFRGPACATMC